MLKILNSLAEGLDGAEVVVLITPGELLKRGVFAGIKDLNLAAFTRVISEAKASAKNQLFETMLSSDRRCVLVLLPDRVSRHNSPTRKQAIVQATADAVKDSKPTAMIIAVEDPDFAPAVVSAVARVTQALSRKRDAKAKDVRLTLLNPTGRIIKPNADLEQIGLTTTWVCQMVDTPPTELNPKAMSDQLRKRFKGLPDLTVSELVGEKLMDAKCGGIFNVGKAAREEPRMLIFDYHPKSAKQTVVIAGKGVTFDTGGLSIKISGAMNSMKSDMGGAAAVMGAFELLVKGGFKHRLVAVAGLVENAVSPDSLKPDDVITFHSGKTVEINNTDAEGRLVLGDCLSYACRKFKPVLAIDAATLTGAQLIATGKFFSGIVSNDDRLERITIEAGKATGDLAAPLPFAPEFFQDEFKSKIADMKNSVADRANAQTSCAAQFIYSHIDDIEVDWLHIDLAGPSFVGERGTAYGTMLIAEVVSRYFKRDR